MTSAAPPPTPTGPSSAAPGWYRDPSGVDQLRYFDGATWTPRVAPAPITRRRALVAPPGWTPPPPPAAKAQRGVGSVLFAVGLLALCWLGWEMVGTNVYGTLAQREAREELADAFAQTDAPNGVAVLSPFEPLPDRTAAAERAGAREALGELPATPATTAPATTAVPAAAPLPAIPEAGAPVGRLVIPKVGVDTVVHAGTDRETLKRGPGLWEYGVMVGAEGNATISGHRTTYGGPFRHIDQLEAGDQIIVELPGQPRAVFEVRGKDFVEPSRVSVTHQTPGVRLTLTTCDPVGSDAQRLVVQAELVEGTNAAKALPAADWHFQN